MIEEDNAFKESFKIYPNPNDGSMWLAYDLESIGKVIIYDLTGVEIANYRLDPTEKFYLINNQNIVTGVYVYRIFSNGAIVHTGKYTVIK